MPSSRAFISGRTRNKHLMSALSGSLCPLLPNQTFVLPLCQQLWQELFPLCYYLPFSLSRMIPCPLYPYYSLSTDPITVFPLITKGQHPRLPPHLCRPWQSPVPLSLLPNLAPVLGKPLSSHPLGFLPPRRVSLWGSHTKSSSPPLARVCVRVAHGLITLLRGATGASPCREEPERGPCTRLDLQPAARRWEPAAGADTSQVPHVYSSCVCAHCLLPQVRV